MLSLWLVLISGAYGLQTSESHLGPRQTLTRNITAGEVHSYILRIRAGQFVHAVADQKGSDVEATLFKPSGSVAVHSDLWNANRGPEPIITIADETGDYRLEVHASTTGAYDLRLVDLRTALPEDWARVEAEKRIEEARVLEAKRTPGNIASALKKNEEALAYFRAVGDSYRQALTVKHIGTLLASSGNLRAALESFNLAQDLFHSVGDRSQAASTYNNAGGAYELLGEATTAMERYRAASQLYHSAGERGLD